MVQLPETDLPPILTGRIVSSRDRSEAMLWDFRHVIEELIAENYYGTMHRLAARRLRCRNLEFSMVSF